MEIVKRKVILPTNQSFIYRELELKNNKGVIHTHEKYELNYIIDAYGRRFVAGHIERFYPGDLVLMGPNVPHCWEIDNKEMEPRAYTIHFKLEFFENVINNIPELALFHSLIKKSKSGIFLKDFDNQKLLANFSELNTPKSNFDKIIDVLNLLKSLTKIESIQLLSNKGFTWDSELPQNQRLSKIYEYVLYNFQNTIQLNEVSSLIGLSEGAFCSFFKKNTKKTFSGFIKEVRIGYACKLLGEDLDRPISEICFESGYNNFANFNRQFKEIVKKSPKEYRLSLTE
jgi:AraC-like DNA-binding protein